MSEIFEDVIQQIPENDENCAPNYRDVRHILYYHRKKQLPCIPKTVSDINFSSSWAKTLSGKQFLLAKNDEVGAVVMSTRFFIENLSDCDTILANGTFKTAPEPFAQIYTIFGVFENQKIPLVFAFLSNKKKESYIFLLRLLEAKAEKLGKRFSPEIFLTDFESGFCAAIKNCFPMAQHLGCHFHYCQAIFKKVQKFHLAGISEIFDYFEKTWLNEKFSVKMWNLYNRPPSLNTTNSCEGWHHIWNKKVGRFHPNFWDLIRKLKREEKMSKLALKSYQNGDLPPKTRKKYRKKRDQISALKKSFASRNRDIENYWKTLCVVCYKR